MISSIKNGILCWLNTKDITIIEKGRVLMAYRVVISLEEMNYVLELLDEKHFFENADLTEQDDYLWIKEDEKTKGIVALNSIASCYIRDRNAIRRTRKRSFYCIVINLSEIEAYLGFKELICRYYRGGKSMASKEIKLEEKAEELMTYSDDDLYNINSWGADLSFREIITMYEEGELLKPELQRKYVWTRTEASRFIDSILLGLPVPSVFFAKEQNETMLIIDGFQRIMTVNDYVKGIFSGDGKIFKLSNTENINARWRGKAFAELETEEKRRIRNTTIHAIIFEQKYPRNDTGMFQIFERINTGGRTLKAQEIRNCVYQGKCNDLLFELNKHSSWRKILGLDVEDSRMADLELILRYFAMKDLHDRSEGQLKQINLAKYLNQYMSDKTDSSEADMLNMKQDFINMTDKVFELFGGNAFKNLKKDSESFANKINPAIFDAISVATSYVIKVGHEFAREDYLEKYKSLLKNEEFHYVSSSRTTNVDNIKKRIELASKFIYGVDYEW